MEGGYTNTFVLCVIMCVFAGSFQYGYNISGVNGPAEDIKARLYPKDCDVIAYINSTHDIVVNNANCTADLDLDEKEYVCRCDLETEDAALKEQDAKFAFAVSSFTIGGIVGSFSTGFLVSQLGRKKTQMLNCVVSIIAAVFYYLSYHFANSIMFIVARVLIGGVAGLATGVCPMYTVEISPINIRGSVGVVSQLFITIGLLTAQIISFPQIMGKPHLWGWFLSMTGLPAVLFLILSPKILESPRYTLLEKHDENQAELDLQKLRKGNVKDEFENLKNDQMEVPTDVKSKTVFELFTDKSVRWQIIIIIVCQMGQQLCGINAVFFYTNKIFKAAGFDQKTSTMISSLVGIENVLMTFVSMAVIEKLGRKSLQVYGYIIVTFFCVALTVCIQFLDASPVMPYLCVACVLGYIVGFAIGPAPVPWIWNSELFNQQWRGPAGSVACALNWTCTFLVGLFFPPLQNLMGAYVFIIFAGVSIFVLVFLIKFAPETKGKTFAEIEAEFNVLNGITPDEEAVQMKKEDS